MKTEPTQGETFRAAKKALENIPIGPDTQVALVVSRFDPGSDKCRRAMVTTIARFCAGPVESSARAVSGLRRALETQERRLLRWWRERGFCRARR